MPEKEGHGGPTEIIDPNYVENPSTALTQPRGLITHECLQHPTYKNPCPCGLGIRIQPTFALVRVLRGD